MKRKVSARTFRLLILFLTTSAPLTPPHTCAAQTTGEKDLSPRVFGEGLKRYERSGGKSRAKDSKDEEGQPEEVVRMNTLLTLLDVTVTDASGARFIDGLTKDDFVVVEDGAPQQIDSLTRGDDTARMPRSIVLIIDYSGSLLPYLHESIKAAKALVDKLAPTDEMAVVTDGVELVVGFTRNKKQLKRALDSLGKSAQHGEGGGGKQIGRENI